MSEIIDSINLLEAQMRVSIKDEQTIRADERNKVIEMYHAKLYSMLLRMPWVKRLTNKEVMELNDKVAEKMKGK